MATNNNIAPQQSAPHFPEQVTGMYILARALKNVGIENVYGLVGIPITEAAYLVQGQGIRFVGFRHEQQAGMAAATEGFLTKKPGVLMTVSSLGFMNGLTATANATVNCYPMIQISGASDPTMVDMNMGTYEQLDQFNTAKPLVKAAFRCSHAKDIPSAVARAYRAAVSGRPGGVYIDMTTPALGENHGSRGGRKNSSISLSMSIRLLRPMMSPSNEPSSFSLPPNVRQYFSVKEQPTHKSTIKSRQS